MGPTEDISIVKARSPDEREACFAIRNEVFVVEQKVPHERDRDGLDDAALHFLARRGREPVGTARVRFKDNGATAKIERVAIRKPARGLRLGAALMRFIEADDDIGQAARLILEAQTYIIPFYERLGYKASGDEFMDAGIPHRLMSKANPAMKKRAAQS